MLSRIITRGRSGNFVFTTTSSQTIRYQPSVQPIGFGNTGNRLFASTQPPAAAAAATTTTTTIKEPAWQQDLNEAQIDAVTKPLYSITRVIAGPGSGKTRVLTSRIAYILEQDPKARILAVTFTRKAAGEMQERLERLLKSSTVATSTAGSYEQEQQQQQQQQQQHQHTSHGTVSATEEEYYSEGAAASTYLRDMSRATLGTFHKICSDILRYNGNLLAALPSVQHDMMGRNATMLDGSFAIMDQSDQLRIMKECLKLANLDLKDAGGVKPILVLNALSDIKAKIVAGEDPFETDANKKKKKPPAHVEYAQKIYGTYRENMLSNNLLDFDDLIYLTRELLMEHQEVRQQLHRRWTHILVDEYQDTSRAQIDLVRLWTSSSLLVVGDGDQSIYSWRGADPQSLSTFEQEFQNYLGDIETVHLTDNYRSTSNIVDAAHKVILSGEKSKIRQKMNPQRGSGSTPRIVACADGKAEASFVVKTIKKMLADGPYTPASTVAILYRTNAQSRLLEEACVNNNLPYVILGKATSFYKRREVKDCLCFLRWLYNGRDKGSMVRTFQTPSRGLGEKAIEQFEEYCSLVFAACIKAGRAQPTYLDILLSFPHPEDEEMPVRKDIIATRPLKLFTEFARQMDKIRELAYSEPVEKILALVIDEFELMSHFDKTSDSKAEFEERQGNVQELQSATRRYTDDGPCLQGVVSTEDNDSLNLGSVRSPLGAFLDDVALVTESASEKEEGSNKKDRFVVSLMTIHASKGMEFDGVFLTGCEDDNFPTSRALQAGNDSVELAEECRLCYVAMTRAKSDLFMTWRKEDAVFSPNAESTFRFVKRNRSRFLDALVAKKKSNKEQLGKLSGEDSSESLPQQRGDRGMRNGLRSPIRQKKAIDGVVRNQQTKEPGQRRSYSNGAAANFQERLNLVMAGTAVPTGQSTPPVGPVSSTSKAVTQRRSAPAGGRRESSTSRSHPSQQASPATMSPPPPPPPKPATTTQEKAAPKPKQSKAGAMESTWFYPVGSAVVHTRHGRGLVLNPPPPCEQMLVRVKFENGSTVDISCHGDDLRPDFE